MSSPKAVLCLVVFLSVLAIPAYAQHGHGGGRAGIYHGGGYGGYYGGHYYGGYYGGRYGYYGGRYYAPRVYYGFGWGYPYYGYYPYYYGYPYFYGYSPYYYGYYPYPYRSYPAYSAPPAMILPNNYNSDPPQSPSAIPRRPQTQQPPPVQPPIAQEQNFYPIAFTNHFIEAATPGGAESDPPNRTK